MLYGHGDDIYNYNQDIQLNFSSNIRHDIDLTGLYLHLEKCIPMIHTYPEPDAQSLKKKLADSYGIPESSICVTNGATEAIYLIAQAFRGKCSGIPVPTFREYNDACILHEHKVQSLSSLEEIPVDTELIWLCNPNNPTGKAYDIDKLKVLIEAHPEIYFIIDHSYAYFTDKKLLKVHEAISCKNIILLHSMTKHYAIPGLRLGYITAHPQTLAKINAFRMPWAVNQLAIEAGKYLLDNELSVSDKKTYLEGSKELQHKLNEISGITTYSSDSHFFLGRLDNRKASDLKEYLVENHNILIRDASNFEKLDNSYFRVAAQSSAANDKLVNAIKLWMKDCI